jgi:hypothetical protein
MLRYVALASRDDAPSRSNTAAPAVRTSISVSAAAQYTVHASRSQWAKLQPKSECASCHMASAKNGDVWTQFYPLLDN